MASCYNGNSGALAIGATNVAELTSWSITTSGDTIECTSMAGSAGSAWKTFKAGNKSFEVSGECIWADDATTGSVDSLLTLGATVTFTAYPLDGGTVSFSGSGIVSALEYTVDMDDVMRATFTLQGTGALAIDDTV